MLKSTLFAAHIDLTVIPHIPDTASGLPDSSFVNEQGERDSEVLATRMGLNRKMRRFLKSQRTGLAERLMKREDRIRRFLKRVGQVVDDGAAISLQNDLEASWEAQAFSRVLPGWEFIGNGSQQLELYTSLHEDDQQRLRDWYRQSADLVSGRVSPGGQLGVRPKRSAVDAIESTKEYAFRPSACALLALLNGLDQWSEANDERRVDLAEAAFAAFTLFGRNVLAACVMKTPALYGYYKYIRTANGERPSSPTVIETTPTAMSIQHQAPMALGSLYAEIFEIASRAKADPSNVSYALTIEALLANELPRLRVENAQLSAEDARAIIESTINWLEHVGAQYSAQYFGDGEFLKAFRAVWWVEFSRRLREPATFAALENASLRRVDQALDSAKVAAHESVTTQLQQCIEERDRLEAESTAADFRRKAAIRRAVADVDERIARVRREISEIGDSVLPILLPTGVTLDSLGEVPPASFDVHSFDASYSVTLRSFQEALLARSAHLRGSDELQPSQDEQCAPAPAEQGQPADAPAHDRLRDAVAAEPCEADRVLGPEDQVQSADVPIAGCMVATNLHEQPLPSVATTPIVLKVTHLPIPSPADELQIDVLLANPDDAHLRLFKCKAVLPRVPAAAAENIALLWLDRGYSNLAAHALHVIAQIEWIDPAIDPRYVLAAFRGTQVWRSDQASITRIHKDMSVLTEGAVSQWMERRPTGRLIPYLAFASSFQPTLFCGTLTNAHRLLASVAPVFDGPANRLVEELIAFTSRNSRLDVDTLQSTPRNTDDRDARRVIAEKLRTWRDRILNKQTGWAPSRKAIKECLQMPSFVRVMDAIERDDASSLSDVATFAAEYRSSERQAERMDDAVAKTMSGGGRPPIIEGAARTWFLKSLSDFVMIVDEWLTEHASASQRSDEAARFARRFATMNQAAAKHLHERAKLASTLEQQVGLSLSARVLDQIQKVIEKSTAPIWDQRRAENWLSWPAELMAELDLEDRPVAQLEWLADNLVSALDLRAMMLEALERKNFRHASLLLLARDDAGVAVTEERASLELRFVEVRRTCIQEAEDLRALVDNAAVASLIDESRHYQLMAEIEHLQEALAELQIMDSLDTIREELNRIAREIGKAFNWKVEELKKDLGTLVDRARLTHGPSAVSVAWLEQVERALEVKQTTIAEEMIDHLKSAIEAGTPLDVDMGSGVTPLKEFLRSESEIYTAFESSSNPREIVSHLKTLPLVHAMEGKVLPPTFKQAVEDLLRLQKGRFKHLEKELYSAVCNALGALGLDVVSGSYSASIEHSLGFEALGRFCRMNLTVQRTEHVRGIRFFSEGPDRQNVTVVLGGDWGLADLKKLLAEHLTALPERTIFLSGRPMSSDDRNEFAAYCKRSTPPQTLYHVDPVMLVMLATRSGGELARLKNFLQLSQPWTYANPYTGDQMRPAPPEMRYGRQNDVRALTQMHNGAAIIFGGRQLGKTTLLKEADRQFNREQGQHAFMRQMDGNLDRSNLSGNELEKHRGKIWEIIYDEMRKRKLVNEVILKEEDKKAGSSLVDAQRTCVEEYFRRPNADAVLVCLDEMDRILGLDAANGFRIFRELSSLVNTSNGRFKVIIAGLENVRRFADAPNYPLAQLGSAIQVSIMSPIEAIELVRDPLEFLGYEFESPLLINRVLVETNRHPGLIHFFCHKLVRHLASRHSERVGVTCITAQDVTTISRDRIVREVISDRFEITLNLDQRYKVIAFSLIDHGTTRFSASRAKDIASDWAPEQFGPMSEVQFEAFLDELCGLGVLHSMHSTSAGKEYALRNANILNLMGGKPSVEGKLLKAIEEIMDDDPLSGHACPARSSHPSPLTLRDEKQLIGDFETVSSNHGAVVALSTEYSVALVTGSEALGLKTEWMLETLPLIGEEENPRRGLGSRRVKYTARHKSDVELADTADFKRLLNDLIIRKYALSSPEMLFIDVQGEMSISHTLDLIDIAHECGVPLSSKQHRVRVIFLMHPKAVWQWISNPILTAGRATQQPIIALRRWSRTAMTHFLNKLDFANASTDVGLLEEYSQGWYSSMKNLQGAHTRKPDVGRLHELGTSYLPILKSSAKSLQTFLTQAGVRSVDWAESLLRLLPPNETFDSEDVEIRLMELGMEIDPPSAIRWLTELNLITPQNNRGKPLYRMTLTVAVALATQA